MRHFQNDSAENPFEQHAAFLRTVMRNEPAPVSLQEAFYDMRLVEAAYRSGRTGQTVEV